MDDDALIWCVECGYAFYLSDADDVCYATSSVSCPECGRSNYCESVEASSLGVDAVFDDGVEDTDEIYMENYLSDDLEYDGVNRFEPKKQKRIGVAKQKRSLPRMPIYEARKAIAEALVSDELIDSRTRKEMEDLISDGYSEEDFEQ